MTAALSFSLHTDVASYFVSAQPTLVWRAAPADVTELRVFWCLCITSADDHGVESPAGHRHVPIHSEPVRAGYRFVCTTTQAGGNRPIQVVEIDGRGHLRWQLGP